MSAKRDSLADCLKGYACILVVLDHVLLGIENAFGAGNVPAFSVFTEDFVGKFHVALFMFISGYVFNITGGVKKRGLGKTLLHKLINIGIPYFVFSVIYILLNSFVGGDVNTSFGMGSILTLWYEPVAQYWFLYALLLLFVCYCILTSFMPKIVATAVLFLVYLLSHYAGLPIGPFSSASNVALVFGLGYCIDNISFDAVKKGYKILIGIVCMACLAGIVLFKIDLPQICQILGICGSIAIISVIINYDKIKRFLLFICKYSLPIYLLHTIFTSAVRIVLIKLGIKLYVLHFIAGIAVGFVIPIIIGYLMKKLVWPEFVLYPSATYKKLRKTQKNNLT